MKTAGSVAMRFGLRTAGALGGAALANIVSKPGESGKPILDKKFAGPALLGIGLLGEVFIEDENLRAPFEGISTIGAFQTIADIKIGEERIGAKIGLGNVLEEETETELGSIAETDLEELIAEARALQGDEYESAIPAINAAAPTSPGVAMEGLEENLLGVEEDLVAGLL